MESHRNLSIYGKIIDVNDSKWAIGHARLPRGTPKLSMSIGSIVNMLGRLVLLRTEGVEHGVVNALWQIWHLGLGPKP